MSDLHGKIVLVTGAASGIGEATALKCATAGANIILFDKASSQNTADSIRQQGGKAYVIQTDVSDPVQMGEAFQSIQKKWQKIDAVFANAGINGKVAPIEDLSAEDWDHTLTVNLRSTFLTVKHAIPLMRDSGGSIVITSSVNGSRIFSSTGMSAYSSSKAGQMAFGKMAALELSSYNIRVNVICPGAFDTNISDRTYREENELKKVALPIQKKIHHDQDTILTRTGKPEQAAELVVFLVSDNSAHITGTEIFIDGAQSML